MKKDTLCQGLETPETRFWYRLMTPLFAPKTILTGAQMLFVAFGALVLVPLLTGLDANVALFSAGAGIGISAITRGQVPVFLASSFAFYRTYHCL